MEILVKPVKDIDLYQKADGFVLPIKDYSVDYRNYYTLDEIKSIVNRTNKKIFVVMNKMMENSDIENIKNILIELDKINIYGIFFYDLSIIQLKKELNLNVNLVWNNTHMVTNYSACNYYYEEGCKYSYLSNEITLDDILLMNKNSKSSLIFMLLGYPVASFSKRKLVSNSNFKDSIIISEDVSKQKYIVFEDKNGTTFKYNKIRNNSICLKELLNNNFPFIYLIEDDIDHDKFIDGLNLTSDFINNTIDNNKYVSSMKELFGSDTGFLYRKTIYKVTKK
ncbi:MAG: U32 family peptidase [Bacilli bacterium]|nr:U32 family peptidase [Bacilli bacterium]